MAAVFGEEEKYKTEGLACAGEALFGSPVLSHFKGGVNTDAHGAQINIFALLKQHGGALFGGISLNKTHPSGREGR